HALDGLGIDVVQARWIATAAGADVVSEAAAPIDAHAVHVHDRLVRLRQTGRAANPDACAFTRQPARWQNTDARGAPGEHFGNVLHRCVVEFADIYGGDRVSKLASYRGDARPCHDHHVESDRHLAHHDISKPGRVLSHRHDF